MFAKTFGIIVLDLSGTQDMNIQRTRRVHLECTFAKQLAEIIAIISLNKLEAYSKITPEGNVLLDHAARTQIK